MENFIPTSLLLDLINQPQIQVIIGGALAVSLRAIWVFGWLALTTISRRAKSELLEKRLQDIELYTLYEKNPAIVTARSIQLQLLMAAILFAFCMAWQFSAVSSLDLIPRLGLDVLGTLLSAAMFWKGIDLFVLVRPLALYRENSTGLQLLIKKVREQTQKEQVVAEEIRKRNAIYEQAIKEAGGSGPGPQSAKPDGGAKEPPLREEDITVATTAAPEEEEEEEGVAQSPRPEPSPRRDPEPEPQAEPAEHQESSGSVYESAWIVGRVKRWPDGAPFGFLEATTGEEFYANQQSLTGPQTPIEGREVLFQPFPGVPHRRQHRRASLVCAVGSYGQGRINGIGEDYGFITVEDAQRADSIYFRVSQTGSQNLAIGQLVEFQFGRNFIGPTAERVVPVVRQYRSPSDQV